MERCLAVGESCCGSLLHPPPPCTLGPTVYSVQCTHSPLRRTGPARVLYTIPAEYALTSHSPTSSAVHNWGDKT